MSNYVKALWRNRAFRQAVLVTVLQVLAAMLRSHDEES